MFWVILWILVLVLGIGLVLLYFFSDLDISEGFALGCVVIGILGIIFVSFASFMYKQENATWNQQKEVFETMSGDQLLSTNVGLKIIEQNNILFKRQYWVKNFGFFTLVPKEVLDLEPIKTVQ